jgi:GNAT superfamily N-acetyltransferase
VYSGQLHLTDHSEPPLGERLARHAARPGFGLIAGHAGGRVAGFVYGYSLPADTLWWEGLRTEGPAAGSAAERAALTREWPGRTVGICEGLVHPDWRRHGFALRLHAEFLATRHEERAVALVAEDNRLLIRLGAGHGWRPVGRLRPFPGWRPHVALVLPLR